MVTPGLQRTCLRTTVGSYDRPARGDAFRIERIRAHLHGDVPRHAGPPAGARRHTAAPAGGDRARASGKRRSARRQCLRRAGRRSRRRSCSVCSAALLRGQELVQVARLRRGKNDVALLDGQRVLESYDGMDEALRHALDVPDKQRPRRRRRRRRSSTSARSCARSSTRSSGTIRRFASAPTPRISIACASPYAARARRCARHVRCSTTSRCRSLRAELKWLGGRARPGARPRRAARAVARSGRRARRAGCRQRGKIVTQLETEREHVRQELLASARVAALRGAARPAGAVRRRAPGHERSTSRSSKWRRREFRKLERLAEEARAGIVERRSCTARASRRSACATRPSCRCRWPGKDGRKVIAAAKKFQDVVGAHQDAVVAEERIRSALRRARGVGTGVAAGRLIERERARRQRSAGRVACRVEAAQAARSRPPGAEACC